MSLTPPVTVDQVRSWTRIDTTDDDDTLANLILAGLAYAEAYTGLTLDQGVCPEPVKQAIIVFVADTYANREGQLVGSAAVRLMLDPFRSIGL